MKSIFSLIGQMIPWAMSFASVKFVVYGALAAIACMGGYVMFSGQSAKTTVEVLRRENQTLSRGKAAIELRIQSDGKVSSLEHAAKLKELRKWAVATEKE